MKTGQGDRSRICVAQVCVGVVATTWDQNVSRDEYSDKIVTTMTKSRRKKRPHISEGSSLQQKLLLA